MTRNYVSNNSMTRTKIFRFILYYQQLYFPNLHLQALLPILEWEVSTRYKQWNDPRHLQANCRHTISFDVLRWYESLRHTMYTLPLSIWVRCSADYWRHTIQNSTSKNLYPILWFFIICSVKCLCCGACVLWFWFDEYTGRSHLWWLYRLSKQIHILQYTDISQILVNTCQCYNIIIPIQHFNTVWIGPIISNMTTRDSNNIL